MLRQTVCWLFLILLIAAAPATAAPRAGEISIDKRVTVADDGTDVPYEIGTIWVPENRNKADSRLIGVGFARIRAQQPSGAPPVFWLPGGPGLAVLDTFTSDSEAARSRLKTWRSLAAVGDVVVVEQRGYTLRGEQLEVLRPARPLDRPRTAQADAAYAIALARQAVAEHKDKDLAGYTVQACADDVDEVRRALGYQKISLFAASFGSQWSFAVMRKHPGIVARAVLSGVEPLDYGYDMPSPMLATLRRIAAEADRDPRLQPWLPPGGLMAAADQVRTRLARQAVTVTVHDAAGKETKVTLGLEDFQGDLLGRARDHAQWPAFVLALYHGHYEAWARDVVAERQPRPLKLVGPLIDTSLGVTPQRLRQLRSDPALPWIGSGDFEPYLAAADAWPTPDLGDAYRAMAPISIPTVLVHGDWDTSTPIDNTLAQLPYLAKGHAIIVHRGGHDGSLYLLREAPEAREAVLRFLRTGSMDDLPREVTLPAPAFAVPDFAPPARPGGA